MPHKHRKPPKDEPSKISIFIQNDINTQQPIDHEAPIVVTNASKEDGCASCFKGLFRTLKG